MSYDMGLLWQPFFKNMRIVNAEVILFEMDYSAGIKQS